jgi:hypothetical protein
MYKTLYGKTRKEVQEIFHLRLGEEGDMADHTGQQLGNYCCSRLM